MLAVLMMATVTAIFAQDTGNGTETGGAFNEAFITFSALVAVIPVVTEFIKKLLGKTSDTNNQLVQVLAWITGIAITMFGWFFHLGFLSGLEWWLALLYGFGASLAANGIADTKIIQAVISLFGKK
jgi:hypothetical protein